MNTKEDRKILLVGATGVIGRAYLRILGGKCWAPTRFEMDITSLESVTKYVENKKIEWIINCAANRNAEYLEDAEKEALLVNVIGPCNLAMISSTFNIKLLHISTDYVFDGESNVPYGEDSIVNPLSVYGNTKSKGEKLVVENSRTCIILRTAWLFSKDGNDFVSAIREAAVKKKLLSVVFDQVGSPTYTEDFVRYSLEILDKVEEGSKEVYHLTNEGLCSWFDLACFIVAESGIDCEIRPIFSESYPLKARRPRYSVLSKSKIKEKFNIKIRHYHEALIDCIKNISY